MSDEIIQNLIEVVLDGDHENAEVFAGQAVEQDLEGHACWWSFCW